MSIEIERRNAAIIKMMKEQTERIINDPELLATEVAKWEKWQAGYDAYMKLESHQGDCHCARCMSEFLSK